ncbi:hypothetical protein [Phytoactinopolyspora limicola]|uniref:hypothetical protein n=1 Tax=Phytoactinopolyspora limicola TaxID=2715536 RepID=UPI00140791E7|nr:hypothetical protein [Phytoactinopolyspora limicola]
MPVPSLADRYIVAARLKGYLNKHDEAVALLTEALRQQPDDARLLRFRGHRRISIRDYDGSVADLERAAELLPDTEDGYELYQLEVETDIVHLLLGHPDRVREQHLPVSRAAGHENLALYMTTLHTSVWYHLGVARYLRGDFEGCLEPFARANQTARHREGRVASLDWQYMALRRLNRGADAATVLDEFRAVPAEDGAPDVGYEKRMRLYTGELSPDALLGQLAGDPLMMATQGYGLGNWYLYNHQAAKAEEIFDQVLATGVTHSFAYLAVEAERARAGNGARANN